MTAPDTILVRVANPDELPLVSSILNEAHAWLVTRNLALWAPSALTPEALRPDVEAGHYVLAFVGREAAGTARIAREDAVYWPDAAGVEAVYVHRLAIRRAHAGGAVSRKLIDASYEHACTTGAKFLRLDCRADVPQLRKLYERLGLAFESEIRVNGHLSARFQKAVRT